MHRSNFKHTFYSLLTATISKVSVGDFPIVPLANVETSPLVIGR